MPSRSISLNDYIFLSTPSARRATAAWTEMARKQELFLSTPSARRATTSPALSNANPIDFYPRPPRGGRRPARGKTPRHTYFYPRPPRGGRLPPVLLRGIYRDFYPRPPRGGRRCGLNWNVSIYQFLSTPSARRATRGRPVLRWYEKRISIHALREEGDLGSAT